MELPEGRGPRAIPFCQFSLLSVNFGFIFQTLQVTLLCSFSWIAKVNCRWSMKIMAGGVVLVLLSDVAVAASKPLH